MHSFLCIGLKFSQLRNVKLESIQSMSKILAWQNISRKDFLYLANNGIIVG